MIDIVNNGSTTETAEIIVERYEDQIRDRIAEKDILGVAMNVYSVDTLWGLSFEKVTGFDDPYEYFEHSLGMRKSTAHVYCRIGRVLEKNRHDLNKVDLEKIASPYMLLYLEKALRNHYWHDVVSALTSMSYRQFQHFSNEYSRLPEPGPIKSATPNKGASEPVLTKEAFEQYKLWLRKGFDAGMEVLVVGLADDRLWAHVVSKLRQLQIHAVAAPEEAVDMESDTCEPVPESA
jgi:hypothetical protein